MNNNIPYYYTRIDQYGYVHSIDMIQLEGFGAYPDFKKFCKNHNIDCDVGETNRENKYLSVFGYINFDTVGVNLCEFIGKGERKCSYDDDKEVWNIKGPFRVNAPYWVVRFNPNKVCSRSWFHDFVNFILDWNKHNPNCLFLKKFDYAVDIDIPINDVFVKSRKSSGRVQDTLYFGKANRQGACKIYNKTNELKRQGIDIEGVHTRIEYTFMAAEDFKFDNISKLDIDLLESDEINQTDKFILKAFYMLREQYPDLDLQKEIGRNKFEKLKNHIMVKTEIPSLELLMSLLNDYLLLFHCCLSGDQEVDVEDLETFILEKSS